MTALGHPTIVATVLIAALVNTLLRVDCLKFELGPCFLQYLEPCSEEVIQFYFFSSERPHSAPIALDAHQPELPEWVDLAQGQTKVIVHGYGGNLDFYATKAIRDGECGATAVSAVRVWNILCTCGNDEKSSTRA